MYWKINSNRLIEFKKNAKNLLNHGTNCFFVPPENFVLLKNNVTRTEDLHCLSNELKRDSFGGNQGLLKDAIMLFVVL